jgi:UDP-GlcNAc:undecaprenyl-phosphate/decaprenyl-phosphate GlcNAc-1-phosphate transferase
MVSLRPLAFSIGLVDKPGGRKAHVGEVPLVGGISMFFGLMAGIALLPAQPLLHHFLPLAAGLLVVIGVLDDRFHAPTALRFVTQLSAVLLMVYGAGLVLYDMGDPFGTGTISTGPMALIFTVLVVVATINAFNVVDGIDGLAACLALISLLAVALVASVGGGDLALPLVAAGAVFGFLLFNFPMIQNRPVRSFMGDAGSTMLGLVVVWATLGIAQGEARLVSPVICLWFASVPIYDLFTSFVRRILKGRSPFRPGREHFHHTLMRGRFGVRQTLGILTGLQIVYAGFGLVGLYAGVPEWVMFLSWSVVGISQHRVLVFVASRRRLWLWRRRLRMVGAVG